MLRRRRSAGEGAGQDAPTRAGVGDLGRGKSCDSSVSVELRFSCKEEEDAFDQTVQVSFVQ